MSCNLLENLTDLRSFDLQEKIRESIRYFTGDQFDTFANQLPSRNSDSRFQIFNIHDFVNFGDSEWKTSSKR